MMVFRALLALTLVLCLTQALPLKKANDLSKEIADVAKDNTQKRLVKRSEETVIVGNHQNAPRPALELKNRDENGKIEVKENEVDKTEIAKSDVADDTPPDDEVMEKVVMDLAKVAEAVPETDNNSDLEEKVKVDEDEKVLDEVPNNDEVAEEKEVEEDAVFQPQEIFNLGAREKEINDVNSSELPDQESEVTESSEEVPPEELMSGNMEMAQEQPAADEYQYDEYNALYSDPYQWLDRKKRNVNRQKREAALQGSEAGMSMVANEDDTKSRSKRDTEYPLSLNDLYNLYYKYKEMEDEKQQEEELEPVYELPEYEENYAANPEYDNYGVEEELAPPSEEWEPAAVNDDIQQELELEAMMEPAMEEEAPYYLADDETPEEELEKEMEEELEEQMEAQQLPAYDVPSEPYYYPMEYNPIAPQPDKRNQEMLSMLPGIKRADDFYPSYTEDREPWQALIPPAAEKRGVMEEYARLYRLARALKRSREDSVEERWESLLGDLDEKKK
ncbi:fibrous sheath CABYR-binding protein-like [Lineus longissimus]|uniref:fibrous sheath CABYR-binding protein-like n=1 Tax=Lineus longissimus TaxID=88925 RepID=UPI002B4FB4B3